MAEHSYDEPAILPDYEPLAFFVEGHPQTAGSKTAIANPKNPSRPIVVDGGTSEERDRKKAWREDVREGARRAIAEHPVADTFPFSGPVEVAFVFYRLRPKSHFGTGKNAGVLKSSAPMFPTTRPDALKLARAVEDALTAIVWADDSEIVDERLRKVWGSREGCAVVVRRLPSGGFV